MRRDDLLFAQPGANQRWDARPECRIQHTGIYDGRWVVALAARIGYIEMRDGRLQYKAECGMCGLRSGPMPASVALKALDGEDPAWVQVNDPGRYEPCVVSGCTDPGREYHHFAPRNVFGSHADDWPVLPLCLEHHRLWHSTMNGYQWQAKRVDR